MPIESIDHQRRFAHSLPGRRRPTEFLLVLVDHALHAHPRICPFVTQAVSSVDLSLITDAIMRIEGFLRVISYGLGLQWQIRKRYPRIFILLYCRRREHTNSGTISCRYTPHADAPSILGLHEGHPALKKPSKLITVVVDSSHGGMSTVVLCVYFVFCRRTDRCEAEADSLPICRRFAYVRNITGYLK